jgi:DNA processing protein
VQLSLTTGLGPILIRRLVDLAHSAEAACQISRSDLRCVEGIGEARARAIHESLQAAAEQAESQLKKAGELGAAGICLEDEAYPPLLKLIHDPPAVLWVMGNLEPRDLNALAMVGSRRCSYYGREQAERFAALLAGAGFTVVSGGARGIDSAAHRGAMQHPQGRTITVLGSGLDVPYPPENEGLFKQVAQRGAVISEFAFGTAPTPENFPRRNRVVSGMARGVLVIEADERSGALITARLANEDHGRPVFALPGRVDNPLSTGPHQLIRDGAILASKLEDIVEGLHPFPDAVRETGLFDEVHQDIEDHGPADTPTQVIPTPAVTLSDRQRVIVDQLSDGPAGVDQIVERTNLSAAEVLQELTFLSLKGMVKRVDGQTFVRRKA